MVQQYAENESLQRIYQMLSGGVNPDDMEGTLGQLARNESLARIAQILEGGIAFSPPDSMKASNAEVIAGTSDAKFITPDKLSEVSKFGGIYAWTGTSELTGMPASWTRITGTFQNSMAFSDSVTSQPTQDRFLVDDVGTWFVSWQMSYIGSPDIQYKIEPYCFVGMPQAAAVSQPSSSGTVTSMSGSGFAKASGTAVQFSLYMLPDTASAWLIPVCVQLSAQRVGKY
jgi:hypothetical protein